MWEALNAACQEKMERVLITGGARRIGAQIARRFAHSGWQVVIHCNHSLKEAEALAAELSGEVVCGDLAAAGGVERVLSAAGEISALVNNASTYRRRRFETLGDEQLRADFEINFFAPFALMRGFAARGKPGCIINLLDQRIARPDPDSAGYTLAKQSLAQATRMGALAWAPQGLRVNAVAPGYVRPADGVPMAAMQPFVAATPLRCRSTEEQVAESVFFLAGNAAVTGVILYVDGGLHLPDGRLGEKIKA